MTGQTEAYFAVLNSLNAPVFVVKHDVRVQNNPEAVRFTVYLGTIPVCKMTLEDKWTARDALTGKKISRRKGSWDKAAGVAVLKHIEKMGYEAYRAVYQQYMGERNLMVPCI